VSTFKRRRSPRELIITEPKVTKKRDQSAAKKFDRTWRQMQTLCPDPDSQHRLAWLQQQFMKQQRGAMESAQAEIDIASLLAKAGFSLSFVKESETATADLECYLGNDRFFVEVTVIVPSDPDRSNDTKRSHDLNTEDESSDFFKDALVKRLLARINEKANQLADYCAPVVLAISMVHQEQKPLPNGKHNGRKMALDLQQLGGMTTHALGKVPHVSAVLLTLWNIQPAESRSNIRLSNVSVGEWVSVPKGFSQVRCLAVNPAASYPIEPQACLALKRVL